MRILGIDPGYAIVGYGIVDYSGGNFQTVTYGKITTEAGIPLAQRLLTIYKDLEEIIRIYNPKVVAVEELFFYKNVKTAIDVGQGRGVILLAAAAADREIFEYTPLQVKQAVVGYGRAAKEQVQQMVKALLKLKEIPRPDDVADALAVAVCHAHSYKMNCDIRGNGG